MLNFIKGVLGITGTKGKSTVAYLLRSILDSDEDGTRDAPHTGILELRLCWFSSNLFVGKDEWTDDCVWADISAVSVQGCRWS